MASVQQLKSRIGQLRHELSVLETQLTEAQAVEAGLQVGDIVRELDRQNREGSFVRFCSGVSFLWIRVRVFRKDGRPGREVTFYRWERVAAADAA